MKVKYLLTALAIPMAFAACSNDDFEVAKSVDEGTYVADGKIHLGADFMLVGSRDNGTVDTKSTWVTGKGTTSYWMPKTVSETVAEDNLDLTTFADIDWSLYEKDAVGLCYTDGSQIMSNYKFYHDGWVEFGKGFSATPYQCVEGVYGYTRNYLRFPALEAAKSTIESVNLINGASSEVKGILNAPVSTALNDVDEEVEIDELNLCSGVFKTDEKTIFAGDYIVYYPFSTAMLKAGNLTATSPVQMLFKGNDYENRISELNKYTFSCGWNGAIEGGTDAAEFKLNAVSSLLSMPIANYASNYKSTTKLILLDVNSNFVNEMELTPAQIKDKNFAGAVTKTSQTIMIDFGTPLSYTSPTWTNVATVIVPAFRANIPAMYVITVGPECEAQYIKLDHEVNINNNVVKVKGNDSEVLDLDEFDYDVVTNEAELRTALASSSTKEILLLGEIPVTNDGEFAALVSANKKTLVGYLENVKVGELIIEATDATTENVATFTDLTFDCDVTVKAPGCCHKNGGVLDVRNITVTKRATVTNHNKVYVGEDGTTRTRTINNLYGTLNNDPYIAEEFVSYTKVAPTLLVKYPSSLYVYGELNNNAVGEKGKADRVESYINIESDPSKDDATRRDGEISVVKSSTQAGKMRNYGLVENYGTMSNQTGVTSNITNEKWATYNLKIGGQLTGALLKNDESGRCDFVCEVDNATDSRWYTAWNQNLANKILIVKDQNTNYNTKAGRTYPFVIEGLGTVSNKKVQVIVENPEVYFVGNLEKGNTTAHATATIGRLLVKDNGELQINGLIPSDAGGNNYKNGLKLTIDNSEWVGIECEAGKAGDAMNIKKTLTHGLTCYASDTKAALIVKGDIKVSGTYDEYATLQQTGSTKVESNGIVTMEADAVFAVSNAINVKDGKLSGSSDTKGFYIEERVQGVAGSITIEGSSYLQIAGDAVVNVSGDVVNKGLAKWVSRTGTKSPGIIYCNDFSASDPNNWKNGTPILNSVK